jgi:hypothetical protein
MIQQSLAGVGFCRTHLNMTVEDKEGRKRKWEAAGLLSDSGLPII